MTHSHSKSAAAVAGSRKTSPNCTPAVVSAALASVPADRTGLASGINNPARQAGGAIGIAAYGALAGRPSATAHFLHGLHVAGIATAGLWVVVAVVSAALVPGRAKQPGNDETPQTVPAASGRGR